MRRRKKKGFHLDFVGIERRTINNCPEWENLSAGAKIFYLHLKARFNGSNNGQIKLTYEEMRGVKGCCSNNSISRASKELEEKKWVEIKKKGGLYRYKNLYKLTFKHDRFAAPE